MVDIHFHGETFQFDRVIAEVKSAQKKAIMVFIGGIHGNEPTGAIALKKVFTELDQLNVDWLGDVYAFTGNLQALADDKRFIDRDLNRVWTPNEVLKLEERALEKTIAETEEQYALYNLIWPLLDEKAPIYFIDLHTTSSPSAPFITINDILANRDYSIKFPVPVVLGIEEYISGPLLSYMNNLETVSLAFEGGQHQDPLAVENHVSFIFVAMVNAGVIHKDEIPHFNFHLNRLSERGRNAHGIYEIRYKKGIKPEDEFKMLEGYANFDHIKKNEVLASVKTGDVTSPESGRIFMPLYQKQGSDGFFIIKEVPKWAMFFSRVLRRFKIDNLITLWPGIKRDKNEKNTILIKGKFSYALFKDIFHLLGYRRKKTLGSVMHLSKREID